MSGVPTAVAPQLDPEQQAVVDHRVGPLLVLAGPGTGKTTTIVESVVARLAEGVEPDSILVLTFGRRAATEVRDRIAARRGGGLLPQVATFHSFAYGLLRANADAVEYLEPPRLLSGAEEDQRIRDLIHGSVQDGSIAWPEDLREALRTHGLAVEVRTLIARMRERDLSPAQLRAMADQHNRPAWAAVADLAEQEEGVMVLENVMDYAELMRRAVLRAGEESVQTDLHRRFVAIYVDEFQDTDPLQVELLRRICGPRTCVVAVGDPDQAIYAFRGADVHGILEFPARFPQADGTPAPVIALRKVRRFGSAIAAAAQSALAPTALPGLPSASQRLHRSPEVSPTPSRVETLTGPSRAARDAFIAQQIRSSHLHDHIPWRDMAVLVRASEDLTGLHRALQLAGVPAAITADEIPLRAEPAVAYLLSIVDVALHPNSLRPEGAIDLLSGPIGRLDVSELRVLGRALRSARKAAGLTVPAARDLIRDVVLGVESVPFPPESVIAAGVRRIRDVVAAVAARIESGAPIVEALWAAWTGGANPHGWPDRLREAALRGQVRADHDLDAVIALFDTAERISDRYQGVYGVSAFVAMLRDQAIPAESIAGGGIRPDADLVQIMTVHRAKGLEWSRVWVVGLEDGRWPNLVQRGSLLGVQELDEMARLDAGDSGIDLMREERNLLYVACTRARDQLTLLAIDGPDSGEDRPSRFLDDLTRAGFPPRPLADQPTALTRWPDLVADVRIVLADPKAPDHVRAQAAGLLAAMSALRTSDGDPLVPAADPSNWWGVAELSQGPTPLRQAEEAIALSGSSLDSIRECSMKWFLDHEVHAETIRGSSTAFGSIVHAIADHVAKGDIPADLTAMDAFVDSVWSAVDFDARWRSEAERREAHRSLERFLTYHQARLRELVDTERYLETSIEVPTPDGGSERVTVRGFLDRVERDDVGRLVAIDFKTGATVPTKSEIDDHGQLGVYQVLLRQESGSDAGGAALIQLRKDTGVSDPAPKEQFQAPVVAGQSTVTWIELALGEAAQIIRSEQITASPGKQCGYCAFTSICPEQNVDVSVIEMVDLDPNAGGTS
jgi:superfamily I DNA/RNA helicase/RecB family exonuclease